MDDSSYFILRPRLVYRVKKKNAHLPVVACRRQYAAEGDPRYRRHWDRVGRRVAEATIVVGRSWAEVVIIASSSSDRIRGKRTKDKKSVLVSDGALTSIRWAAARRGLVIVVGQA